MEKYLLIFEDSSLKVLEGQLSGDDISSVVDGYLQIIRVSDLKQLEADGITWTDLETAEETVE